MFLTKRVLFIIPLFIWVSCQKSNTNSPTLFENVNSEQSGVRFNNQISENDSFNIIQYLYYYNGGGVATGDINNDGLIDIYFAANQTSNALYLNKGRFQFENISKDAHVEALDLTWKTGTTMADVNGDGWLDIYQCAVGNYKGQKGKNKLFINNGNKEKIAFTEKSEEYGLDITCFGTQAAFFDYDLDGDLDMFLLTHSVHSSDAYRDTTQRSLPDLMAGDRLFKNELSETGKVNFTDVTAEAGIYQGKAGYGLGIAISDINNDGFPDIYVSNDFHENDYLYYNNGNGSFREKIAASMGHCSMFSMGSDIADVNNDALPDIMTLDMKPALESDLKAVAGADAPDIDDYKRSLGYYYQYPRNMLQINQGNFGDNLAHFSELGQLSGVSATSWSWTPLIADFDNDGWKDIFVSNGIVRRPDNMDFIKYISDRQIQQKATDAQLIAQMPSGEANNYIFKNNFEKKPFQFDDVAKEWGLDLKGASTAAAYADLDNDGDLDLVLNNINALASIYKNTSDKKNKNNYLNIQLQGNGFNKNGIGSKVKVYTGKTCIYQECYASRGFQSASDTRMHYGLGNINDIDSIEIIWPEQSRQTLTNVKANQLIKVKSNNVIPDTKHKNFNTNNNIFVELTRAAMLQYKHKEDRFFDTNREKLMPHSLTNEGPRLAIGDINGDKLQDVFICGAKGQHGTFILQNKKGLLAKATIKSLPYDAAYEDADAVLFDCDKDDDLDLYVVSGGNEASGKSNLLKDRLYLNDGKGNFKKSKNALPEFYHNGACVRIADFDNDKDMDIFVGSRSVSGSYGLSPDSYLLQNDGEGKFTDVSAQFIPELSKLGMVTDAVWTDMDNDKKTDLVVVGEWMPIQIFYNKKNKFKKITLQNTGGWWNSIAVGDMDADGDVDLICGNLGLNTNLKADVSHPLQLMVKDIDNNGNTDPIMTYWRQEKKYLYASKDELASQIPSIRKRFLHYTDYANSDFHQAFPDSVFKDALPLEAPLMASVYIENRGNGELEIRQLPMEAQMSSINAILVNDFDQDGKADFIIGGNNWGMVPSIGKLDASYGLFLKGDGKGKFESISPQTSGLVLLNQIRDLRTLTTPFGGKFIIAARNNDGLQIFQTRGFK